MHFRRQGTEDSQINGAGDEEVAKMTGHGQNAFYKNHSTDLPQIGLHASCGHLCDEAYSTMSWYVDINDKEHPLIDNKVLTNSNLANMLIDKYEDYASSCSNSNVKWKCGHHFLFTVLPTICEWYVQDSVFRSIAYPKHIATTCVTSKFSRCKVWAERQRLKIANMAETQLKDAIKMQNKASQEILLQLLNQIKTINHKIDNAGNRNTAAPKYSFPVNSSLMDKKAQSDVQRFRSFTKDIETPDEMPPIPNKLPTDFYEFICKYHELQLNKYIGSSKSDWDANLRMRFSRWNQAYELVKTEAKKFTKSNKNTDQISHAAKKLDEDRLRLSITLCKNNMSISSCMAHFKSLDKNRPKRKANQHVPKPRKIVRLNESFT